MKKITVTVITMILLVPILTFFMVKRLEYHPSEILRQNFCPNERDKNQAHRYDFPSENNGWRKLGSAPVYGNQYTGTIFDPYAYIDNGVLCLCASERNTSSIIKLESTNVVDWKKTAVMLQGIKDTWEEVVNRGCVIKTDSLYYLWYTGQHKGKSSIGLAISHDGGVFSRLQEMPIMVAELPFEGVSVMNPCVLWDKENSMFKMWYSAGENYEPDVVCYAESKDGISWEKLYTPVMSKYVSHEWEKFKLGGVNVFRGNDHQYIMYYIGYQNVDVSRICYATSTDGIHWKRPDNNIILSPTKDSWDADAVYKPSYVAYRGKEYIFYNGRDHDDEYLGAAIR